MTLSIDLRERVVACYLNGGGSIRNLSKTFGIGQATLMRWIKLHKETGTLTPRPHNGGRKSPINGSGKHILKELVGETPDITLQELVDVLDQKAHIKTSRSAVCRTLSKMGLSRRKRTIKQKKRLAEFSVVTT